MKLFEQKACRLAAAILSVVLLGNPVPLFADEEESETENTRGYNSAASAAVRNFAAMEDRFLSRFKTVGTTESGDKLPGSGGNAGTGEELVGAMSAATEDGKKPKEKGAKKAETEDEEEKPGALISGKDPQGTIRGWGIGVGSDICLRIDGSVERDSYIVYARHIDSARAYARDADGESALFCENEDWIGEEGILAEPATVTKGRDDLLGRPCGGRQTAVWTDLSAAVILDTKRAVTKLRENAGYGGDPKIQAWARQAAEWFPKAEKGDADARYHLGRLYQRGYGLPRDAEMAAEWFRLAAHQGHPTALADLGFCYAHGNGVAKNIPMSRELLRRAVAGVPSKAEGGDVFAQTNLGRMYVLGAGCRELTGNMAWRKTADAGCLEKDEGRAVEWFRRAAEQGHGDAQGRLGAAYLTGMGVKRDERLAAEWLRKAADQDEPGAQFMLGMLYMHGQGVPKDFRQGTEWFRKADRQGVRGAGQAMRLLTN